MVIMNIFLVLKQGKMTQRTHYKTNTETKTGGGGGGEGGMHNFKKLFRIF